MDAMIDGVELTPLNIVTVPGGNVLNAMKSGDLGFKGFGEAYFSEVEHSVVKAWKRHREMVLNIVVPIGIIRFAMYDGRESSRTFKNIYSVILSQENYSRLTIPAMIWFGFQGMSSGKNMLLNIADIRHDPNESEKMDVKKINFSWEI